MPTTLILRRHAKSGYPRGIGDRDRPPAPRSRCDSALAAAWLHRDVPPIDSALFSTAALSVLEIGNARLIDFHTPRD